VIKLPFQLSGSMKRYLIVGVSVYVFELLVIVLAQALGAGSVAAVAWAFWLGLFVSFGLQKVVTFGDKRLHHRILLPQLAAFSLLVLFNFGFTILLTKLLENILPAVVCRTLALAVTTLWNFYLYKTRIFVWTQPVKGSGRRKAALTKRLRQKYQKWRSQPRIKRLRQYANQPKVSRTYLVLSLLVLFATTLLWSLLGAHLQQSNADQLVNSRLFDSRATFQNAIFPDQHSFLIKWPLFYLIRLFNYTPAASVWITALAVLLTVGAFVYLLWRIEKRPLALGTLCLLLASVLLLVPTQPYAGGLLPVNMAMLATRNLEYILYIAGLVCLVKAPGLRSKQFGWAVVLLGLLVASDRLFLSVGIVGGLLAMVCYVSYKQWELAGLTARWLLAVAAAGLGAVMVAALMNHAHFTHLTGNQTGPYGLAQGAKSVVLGVIFAAGGLLTNFGANPAYDATTFHQIPHSLFGHLLSPAGPAYLINVSVLCFCLYIGGRFLFGTLRAQESKISGIPAVRQLSTLLLWSAIAVIGLFIAANHYHQVDARYLTLCLFALFVVLAGWLRPRRLDAELVVVCLPVFLFGIVCGVIGSVHTYSIQKQALSGVNRRNEIVAQTLASHHVTVVVGDYWRVLPVQSLSTNHQQQVMPLEGCTRPRSVLTSQSWQPDLHHTSFAYLLSFDKGLTDYPQCNLQQVVKAYGIPNSSALIDGSLAHPKELLLFYDRGTHFPKVAPSPTQTLAAVLPISLEDLTHTSCQVPTVMNIVAHQDDDLLFMNPDLQHDISAGNCIRSIYLTAGDAGGNQLYWLSREQGSEAAYSEMTGSKAAWMHRTVRLPGGQFITVANPRGNGKISLIFIHLPDGNLNGQGFGASHHESLDGLEAKHINKLQAVDGQSSYTDKQLTDAITELMHTYQPAEIHTQSNYAGDQYKDHSDHRATGRLAVQAYRQYEAQQFNDAVTIPLVFYMGYPVHQFPANVSGQDLQAKEAAFTAYAAFDNGVCHSLQGCQQNSVYGIYLARQYHNPY
jgi:LmbE family N-acetylglucosaminyl deacetylase/putative flippase GtrA